MKVRVLYWAISDVRRFRSRRRGAATEHDVGTKTPCNSTLAVSVRSVEAGSVTSQEIALHVWCGVIASTVESILESTRTVDMRTGQTVYSRVTLDHSPSPAALFTSLWHWFSHRALRGVPANLLSNYVYADDRGQAVSESRVIRVLAHCYISKGNRLWQTVKYSTKQPKPLVVNRWSFSVKSKTLKRYHV